MPVTIDTIEGTVSTVVELERLRSGEVHVWLESTDATTAGAGNIAEPCPLNAQELDRADCLQLAVDRQRFIFSRAFLRTTLSRYFNRTPSKWVFGYSPHGKPHIVDDDLDVRAIQINVSHSGNWVAVAVAFGRQLGLDIECMSQREVDPCLVAEAFAPTERAHLDCLDDQAKILAMFRYWTLKEAFVKAASADMISSVTDVCFDLTHAEHIGVCIDPRLDIGAEDWLVWQWSYGADLLVALCVRTGGSDHTDAVLRRLGALDAIMPRIPTQHTL